MDLTIIIVNWNTKGMLENCLTSLTKIEDCSKIKIIVVDNDSKDGSIEMVKSIFPGVQAINSGGNIGFGRANNLAIPHADSSLILFLNPDTLVIDDSIKKMINFMMENNEVGAVACKCINSVEQSPDKNSNENVQPLGLQWFPSPLTELITLLFLTDRTIKIFRKFLPYKDPLNSGYVSKLYGTCLMVRRDVLNKIGYFDERFFMYGEDVDISRRITDAGYKLYYLSEAEIIHLGAGASKNTTNQFSTLMMCESIAALMEKYYGPMGMIAYRVVKFVGASIRLFLVLCMLFLSSIKGEGDNNNKYTLYKYMAMLKWSIGLQKPVVKN